MKPIKSALCVWIIFSVSTALHAQTITTPIKSVTRKALQTKYDLCGKLKAKPGTSYEFVSILLRTSAIVSTAKGCHLYAVCKYAQDTDLIWVMEIWDSKEDNDISLTMAGVRELIEQARPLINGKPEGASLDVIGGVG